MEITIPKPRQQVSIYLILPYPGIFIGVIFGLPAPYNYRGSDIMPNEAKRCAIYIRVSTAEQMMHGKSLNAQQEYLEQYAKDHHMTVAGIYADEGKTARKELKKRKAIHSLLEDVKHGKIDVILFWRLDRWFRNLSDFYKVQDILDKYGVSWISASEPGINMETRDGRLQLNVVLSIGQNEVDTTSERIRFVNESSVRQGKLIFGDANMPLGYKSEIKDGQKRMVKDPETEHMVDDFFRYYRTHQSKCGAVQYMQNTYGLDFSYSMLRTMLSSEFYKGTYRGFPYCPAYLTEGQWEEIQHISNLNIRSTPSGRIYLFTGLICCPVCGQKLAGTGCSSAVSRKTGERRTYCYYRCNRAVTDRLCPNRHRVNQDSMEEFLLGILADKYKGYHIHSIKIEQGKRSTCPDHAAENLTKELGRLNLLFQKGRISWEYYSRQYNQIEKKLDALQGPESAALRRPAYLEGLLREDFRNTYQKLSLDNRRAFWRSTIRQIHLNEDSSVKSIDFI